MTLASQVQATIENYLSTAFALTTVTQVMDGGFEDLIVKYSPISSITSVTDTYVTTVIASTAYDFYPDRGTIHLDSGEVWGDSKRRQWSIEYIYGVNGIPEDVQLAIDTWVAALTADTTGNLSSYKTGDDEESYFQIGARPSNVKMILDNYKGRRTIF
jgi:hypothetical protein